MFCAAIDMPKVQTLLAALHAAILEHDPDVSTQSVIYACACIQANALIPRKELSVPFRGKILSGVGDMAASMMRAGLAHGMGETPTAEEAIPLSAAEREEQTGGTELYNTLADAEDGVYTLEEFESMVEDGALTDEDGIGRLAIKDEPNSYYLDPLFTVRPSEFSLKNRRGATHVVWYNK
jgi:hypothetical protein